MHSRFPHMHTVTVSARQSQQTCLSQINATLVLSCLEHRQWCAYSIRSSSMVGMLRAYTIRLALTTPHSLSRQTFCRAGLVRQTTHRVQGANFFLRSLLMREVGRSQYITFWCQGLVINPRRMRERGLQ